MVEIDLEKFVQMELYWKWARCLAIDLECAVNFVHGQYEPDSSFRNLLSYSARFCEDKICTALCCTHKKEKAQLSFVMFTHPSTITSGYSTLTSFRHVFLGCYITWS